METCCSICLQNKGIVLRDIDLNLYKCISCGHVFKNIAKEEHEKYEESYFSEMHKNWFNNPDRMFFEVIYREILKLKGGMHLKVLDVGCGKGCFLKYLKNKNPQLELSGIDLVRNEYPGINFIKGDMLQEDIKTKFDIICNFAVIEHLDSPRIFMKKLQSLLMPDGIIFIATINNDGLIFNVARLLKKVGIKSAYNRLYSKHHLQFFSIKSLGTLMEKCGLDILIQKKYNGSIETVDYPSANFLTIKLYKMIVRLFFLLSSISGNELFQILACRKKKII